MNTTIISLEANKSRHNGLQSRSIILPSPKDAAGPFAKAEETREKEIKDIPVASIAVEHKPFLSTGHGRQQCTYDICGFGNTREIAWYQRLAYQGL